MKISAFRKLSFLAIAVTICLGCWQAWGIPSLAQTPPASPTTVPQAITSCMPARIGGAMRLQASTSLNGVNYYDYYVADLESDDGYDILIKQSGSTCQRLLGSENQRVYAFSHYIPFQAAYQIWLGIYQHRIDAAGGVAQYQKKRDEENVIFCPCFLSEEQSRALSALGLSIESFNYQPYPADGFPAN